MIQWDKNKSVGTTSFGSYIVGMEGVVMTDGRLIPTKSYAVIGIHREFIATGLFRIEDAMDVAEKDFQKKLEHLETLKRSQEEVKDTPKVLEDLPPLD